ncbi:MAG: hypothetical protein AUJ01_08710 [Acidobacteria bacterium 13_1_40CM_3_65_5]|nr:MAG: hypothetical protein AUJ01_08710 [Acidobacteria bacterium 13_1_40CM_3_65_5]
MFVMCAEKVLRLASIDCSWNAQSRLRHERQQPRRLQRDGLSARVRTGDQQHGGGRDDLDRDRDGILEKRMSCGLQLERAVSRQRRLDAVDRFGKPCASLQNVDFRRRLDGPREIAGALAERVGEREQNPPDLLGLLFFERHDVVVDLDGAERLEKQTGTARGAAVHDARDAAAMLGLHHQHVAAVALGDDLVLQVLCRVLAAEVRLERRPQPRALLSQSIPNPLQLGTRIVDHVAGGIDLLAYLRRLIFERRRAAARRVEQRKRRRHAADRRARFLDRVEKRRQREQPRRFERAPFDGQRRENLRQLARRAQRELAVGGDESRRLRRRREELRDFMRIGGRRQPREALGAHGRQREARDGLHDPIEFESPQGARLHNAEPEILPYGHSPARPKGRALHSVVGDGLQAVTHK